jgi:hypothetical protein
MGNHSTAFFLGGIQQLRVFQADPMEVGSRLLRVV